MIIFTPNTIISSTDVNANFDGLENLSVETMLSANFTSTSTVAFQDTGMDIILPEAGKWLLTGSFRVYGGTTAGSFVVVRLYNETTAAAVTDSERIGGHDPGGSGIQTTIAITKEITITATNTIRVEIKPNGGTAQLMTNSDGKSCLNAIKLRT
jgi:hypothetical protein